MTVLKCHFKGFNSDLKYIMFLLVVLLMFLDNLPRNCAAEDSNRDAKKILGGFKITPPYIYVDPHVTLKPSIHKRFYSSGAEYESKNSFTSNKPQYDGDYATPNGVPKDAKHAKPYYSSPKPSQSTNQDIIIEAFNRYSTNPEGDAVTTFSYVSSASTMKPTSKTSKQPSGSYATEAKPLSPPVTPPTSLISTDDAGVDTSSSISPSTTVVNSPSTKPETLTGETEFVEISQQSIKKPINQITVDNPTESAYNTFLGKPLREIIEILIYKVVENLLVIFEGVDQVNKWYKKSITTSNSGKTTTEAFSKKPDYKQNYLCGVSPLGKSGWTVGGKNVKTFGEWPWQVLIRETTVYNTSMSSTIKNRCGGVLINSRYVVTAAHCEPGYLGSLEAVFGVNDMFDDDQLRIAFVSKVRKIIPHRQYNTVTMNNDLALLELETPIHFDMHVVPICLPSDDADYAGRLATVTGWGQLANGGEKPSVLQDVQVALLANHDCEETFRIAGYEKKIPKSSICAGYVNGTKDICNGNDGGPLVVKRDGRWHLVGIVSHGINCAASNLPGVYTRMSYHMPWLRSITDDFQTLI